jgi:hypothetical protein
MLYFRWIVAAVLFASVSIRATAQERQWLLDAADQNVFLVFGVPETNDIGVSFWCQIGKPDITLFLPLPPGEKNATPELMVEIADMTLKTTGTRPEEENGTTVEAKLPDRDKAMAALQQADRFAITIAKHRAVYPLAGADFKAFLDLCDNPASIGN